MRRLDIAVVVSLIIAFLLGGIVVDSMYTMTAQVSKLQNQLKVQQEMIGELYEVQAWQAEMMGQIAKYK